MDYVTVEVRILRKWGFRVRLYETSIRIVDRGTPPMKDATSGKINFLSKLQ